METAALERDIRRIAAETRDRFSVKVLMRTGEHVLAIRNFAIADLGATITGRLGKMVDGKWVDSDRFVYIDVREVTAVVVSCDEAEKE